MVGLDGNCVNVDVVVDILEFRMRSIRNKSVVPIASDGRMMLIYVELILCCFTNAFFNAVSCSTTIALR